MQDTSGVHVWLVLAKAFRALAAHAGESLNLSRTGLGDSSYRPQDVFRTGTDGQRPVGRVCYRQAWLESS